MEIDWTKVISGLQTGLSLVQQLAPLAAAGGPLAAGIGKVASEVASLGQTALTNATTGEAVANATDLATIQGLAANIQAENDALNLQIEES